MLNIKHHCLVGKHWNQAEIYIYREREIPADINSRIERKTLELQKECIVRKEHITLFKT